MKKHNMQEVDFDILSSIQQEKVRSSNPRINILNVTIDVLDMSQTVNLVDEYVRTKTPLHLMGVNADKINEVNENLLMKKIVNCCGVINADGISVVMASKFLGKPLPQRVAGIDLMQNLVELCAQRGYSVYLLGAKQQVVEKVADVLRRKYSTLKIVGVHNGYFEKESWSLLSREINESYADIIFVGITSPLKEYLIEYLQNQGNNAVFMGVGGSFDVISGNIPRAPRWIQKIGMEWFFRVLQEPRRLAKRYFIGNFKFVSAVVKEKYVKNKKSRGI